MSSRTGIWRGPNAGRRTVRRVRGTREHRPQGLDGSVPGLIAALAAGTCGAVLVGYLAGHHPLSGASGPAVPLRVTVIVTCTLCGVALLASGAARRMGHLLLGAGAFSSLWLLNGSRLALPFAIGVVAAGLAPTVFGYVLLAHPVGRVASRRERGFLLWTGALLFCCWVALALTSARLPANTPLLHCPVGCPRNLLYVGGSAGALESLLAVLLSVQVLGVGLMLVRRWRRASRPLRWSLAPVAANAAIAGLSLTLYAAARLSGAPAAEVLRYVTVATIAAIPLSVLAGVVLERLGMGRSLATFVERLAAVEHPDVRALMAEAMDDPSLRIVYGPPGGGAPGLDALSLSSPGVAPEESAVAELALGGRTIASVLFSQELADQERFVQAAGEAALAAIEREQLQVDLAASTAELTASRRRLVDVADAERQRIQRDLHDGAQQHLLAMRIKLDRAVETMHADPARSERILAEIGSDLDRALQDLRSLAAGVYPPALAAYGLEQALRSAARQAPLPVTVSADGLTRYPPEVEGEVYFCCLEAVQNAAKHAGEGAAVRVALSAEDGLLSISVTDDGSGFDAARTSHRRGLLNMRDRLEALGGELAVTSAPGAGTAVIGSVPLCPR